MLSVAVGDLLGELGVDKEAVKKEVLFAGPHRHSMLDSHVISPAATANEDSQHILITV
jgi:hypothetical protein